MKQTNCNTVYEITLKGYNGVTDKTDHLVLWVGTDAADGGPFKVFAQVLFSVYGATIWGEVESNLVDYDLPKDWEELKEYIAKHSIPC